MGASFAIANMNTPADRTRVPLPDFLTSLIIPRGSSLERIPHQIVPLFQSHSPQTRLSEGKHGLFTSSLLLFLFATKNSAGGIYRAPSSQTSYDFALRIIRQPFVLMRAYVGKKVHSRNCLQELKQLQGSVPTMRLAAVVYPTPCLEGKWEFATLRLVRDDRCQHPRRDFAKRVPPIVMAAREDWSFTIAWSTYSSCYIGIVVVCSV